MSFGMRAASLARVPFANLSALWSKASGNAVECFRATLSAHLATPFAHPAMPRTDQPSKVRFTSSMMKASTVSPTLMSLKFLMLRPHS